MTDSAHNSETHFFRNPRQYEWLAERLPREGHLKVWSAGCASGAELYSVLILLAEADLLGNGLHVELYGTDRDPSTVERARKGEFTEWELRGLSSQRRSRYFEDGHFRADLRRHVRFEVADLMTDPAPSGCDLIFFRNVLIYYRPSQVQSIMAVLASSLNREGTLLLGYAEAPQALVCPFLKLQEGVTAAFQALPAKIELPAQPLAAPLASDPSVDGTAQSQSQLRKALLSIDRGHIRQALEELRRLLYSNRHHPAGHYYLGLVWRIEGQAERAHRHFRTAIEQLEKRPQEEPVEDLELTCGDLATLARWQMGWHE